MATDFNRDDNPDHPVADAAPTVALPPRFIFVKHHPHANKPNEIIPLDTSPLIAPLSEDDLRPAPLPDANYKFASHHLDDLHVHAFSSDCSVTFDNHREMEKSLAAARTSNISFHRKILEIDFVSTEFGGIYKVEVEFWDPWQIMKQWVSDETLVPVSTWFSQEKYFCKDGTVDLSNQLYDEPWTGRNWKQFDVHMIFH
ncbi:hypothetical protein DFH09DRAFT_1320964 [Mycena vulgaris]|nr:hypothetical protein DFH09DRAFT_1320964 [Mycena vulgaris]